MTQATFVKKAQKNIYAQGKLVTKIHKTGKNAGEKYEE